MENRRLQIDLDKIEITHDTDSSIVYIETLDGGYYCMEFDCDLHEKNCEDLVSNLRKLRTLDPAAGWEKLV